MTIGFSVFVGEALTVPGNQVDVKRVLRYILRAALPLERLTCVERIGQVCYQDPHGPDETWPGPTSCSTSPERASIR